MSRHLKAAVSSDRQIARPRNALETPHSRVYVSNGVESGHPRDPSIPVAGYGGDMISEEPLALRNSSLKPGWIFPCGSKN